MYLMQDLENSSASKIPTIKATKEPSKTDMLFQKARVAMSKLNQPVPINKPK